LIIFIKKKKAKRQKIGLMWVERMLSFFTFQSYHTYSAPKKGKSGKKQKTNTTKKGGAL
jgi:hypothetical protein